MTSPVRAAVPRVGCLVCPGQWVERKLLNKPPTASADAGKVIGGFVSSALVHSFSVQSVLGGDLSKARGVQCCAGRGGRGGEQSRDCKQEAEKSERGDVV